MHDPVRRTGVPRRLRAVVGVIVLVGVLGACDQMTNPKYDVAAAGCSGTSDATIRSIQERLTVDGVLRNGRNVETTDGSTTFVSAELHLRSQDPHTHGDLLTWVTDDVDGSDFASVDVNARDDSSWPGADVDVRAPGARESRACVLGNRGKTKGQVQCEQDQASGEVRADLDCEKR